MIQLNYRDAKPIYEQIKEGLRRLVMTNAIVADEKLPSVRELAANLAINPNTIGRAYRELENEGYVYTVAGKGTFAAPHTQRKSIREEELLQEFDSVVMELLYMSVKTEQLNERMQLLREDVKQ